MSKQKFNIGDYAIAKGIFRSFGYGTVVDVLCSTRHANNKCKCRKLYLVEYLNGHRRSYWSYELVPYVKKDIVPNASITDENLFNFISDNTIPDNLIEYVEHDINMCNTLNINVKYVQLEKSLRMEK